MFWLKRHNSSCFDTYQVRTTLLAMPAFIAPHLRFYSRKYLDRFFLQTLPHTLQWNDARIVGELLRFPAPRLDPSGEWLCTSPKKWISKSKKTTGCWRSATKKKKSSKIVWCLSRNQNRKRSRLQRIESTSLHSRVSLSDCEHRTQN